MASWPGLACVSAATLCAGYTFATLALHPGMGATHFLPRLIGDELAARLLLTGELFTGARAKEMRLVHEVCESEAEVLPLAKKIAHQIAACSTPVIRTTLAYVLMPACMCHGLQLVVCVSKVVWRRVIISLLTRRVDLTHDVTLCVGWMFERAGHYGRHKMSVWSRRCNVKRMRKLCVMRRKSLPID
jgi:hypothetical protein